MGNIRYLSSDNPEIQSASQHTHTWEFFDLYLSSESPEIQFASQYTQGLEILDLYHLIIQKFNLLVNIQIPIYTYMEILRSVSSDNAEIQFASQYTQA